MLILRALLRWATTELIRQYHLLEQEEREHATLTCSTQGAET